MSGAAAIVGLGISDVGRVYGKTAGEFAMDAVRAAVADAGLQLSDIDGLITSNGVSSSGPKPAAALGLRNLRLNYDIATAGATAGAAVQAACMAVASGMVDTVVYVHSDHRWTNQGREAGEAVDGGDDRLRARQCRRRLWASRRVRGAQSS